MKKISIFLVLVCLATASYAQLPSRVLVGYWHTWNQSGIPFIKLSDVDSRYNVINLSFIGATGGNINTLTMTPLYTGSGYSKALLITDIATARTAGKTICLSIGGANNSFRLTSTADKNLFVSKMKDLIAEYGVDGIDIDLEQGTYVYMTGTIANPTDTHTTNMILALQELLTWYQTTYSKKMVLTMAPETVYVTGGLSSWAVNNAYGASYLPIIEALRNDIDLMMVQLYNSGSMYDLNLVERSQGSVDFLISQTEAVIRGFTVAASKGTYSGLPASKVVVALPSCASAGSGSMSTTNVSNAINYLMGIGPKPGAYTLIQSGGYPALRGMMTWSINNDNTTCGTTTAGTYTYAANYETIFGDLVSSTVNYQNGNTEQLFVFPSVTNSVTTLQMNNLSSQNVNIQLIDMQGRVNYQKEYSISSNQEELLIDLQNFNNGIYMINVVSESGKKVIRVIKQ